MHSIIRIKRKATEPALTSLVVQGDDDPDGGRASKRVHRTNASSTTSPRTPQAPGVFRLAQTVGHEWQGKAAEEAALRQRIAKLLEEQGQISPSTGESLVVESPQNSKVDASQYRYRIIKPATSRTKQSKPPPTPFRSTISGHAKPKETMVKDDSTTSGFRFIDALLEAPGCPAPSSPPQLDQRRHRRRNPEPAILPSRRSLSPRPPVIRTVDSDDSDDDQVAKFLPMLTESLGLTDPESRPSSSGSSLLYEKATPGHSTLPSSDAAGWVYDLYYHTLAAPTDPNLNMTTTPIGTLVGFDPALLSQGDEFISDGDAENTDEAFDEADEDSNEEGFYRNEYPDEDEWPETDDEDVDDAFGGGVGGIAAAAKGTGKEWREVRQLNRFAPGDNSVESDESDEWVVERMPG